MKRHYLLFTGPQTVEIEQEQLPPLGAGEMLIQAEYSAISPGTEMLIYRDQAPRSIPGDKTIPSLMGSLSYPLRYGYSLVGKVKEVGEQLDRDWLGRRVLAFHPHASYALATPDQVIPLEHALDPSDAIFLPNMETAVNLIHDGTPRLGDIVLVFGQGVVGLLTTSLLSRMKLSELVSLEPIDFRRQWSSKMGADHVINPFDDSELTALEARLGLPDSNAGADLCFELSGQPSALDQAIGLTRFSGRIVIGSWYGTRRSELDLGGRFHRNRISIVSSQVSSLNPELSGRWSKDRRLALAQQLLGEIQPSRMLTHTLPFEEAQRGYELLDRSANETLAVAFQYPA